MFLKENAHLAILSKEEFEAAQRRGQSNKKENPENESPLVGRVVCAECGRSMIRSTWQEIGTTVVKFQCKAKTVNSHAKCFFKFVLTTEIKHLLKENIEVQVSLLYKQRTQLKLFLLKKHLSKRREPKIKSTLEEIGNTDD